MALREPCAVVNKDWIAEMHKFGHKFGTKYSKEVRDEAYRLFTQAALEQIKRYSFVCLDAPFTFQADIDKMIRELQREYPDLPILIVTVETPEKDRKKRIKKGRDLVWFMQARPPNDIFETNYDHKVSGGDNSESIIIHNCNGQDSQEVLKPVYESVKRLIV